MAFWRPGTAAPGAPAVTLPAEEHVIAFNPLRHLPLMQQRRSLPIYEHRDQLLYLLEQHQVVILVGHTGCGKTTQVPQYVFEAGWTPAGRAIAVTQPRRIAASTVAARVAQEMGEELGDKVGYAVRFEERVSSNTRIKFMTDGLLVREMMLDPLLSQYSVVMLDEAHERSVFTDLLLALLKKVLRRRPELRLIVSSATVDAAQYFTFFNTHARGEQVKRRRWDVPDPSLRRSSSTVVLTVRGTLYPVDIHHVALPVRDYLVAARETVLRVHAEEPPGDVLVFMTGQEDIRGLITSIDEAMRLDPRAAVRAPLRLIPLYAGLSSHDQLEAFRRGEQRERRVIVSTNIAETSVTIPNIRYVIDSGFVKQNWFDQERGVDVLQIAPVSQASAVQRAGRAGRVSAGKCYRLYTAETFASLPANAVPEIQRTNLAPVLLQLFALGIEDIAHFRFFSPPPSAQVARALELLNALGAVDNACRLAAPIGEQMAELPLDPMLSRMLLASGELHCAREVIAIAAMLSVQGEVWHIPARHRAEALAARGPVTAAEGDHISYLNVFRQYRAAKHPSLFCQQNAVSEKAMKRAVEVERQLERYLRRFGVPIESCNDLDTIRRCIVRGYFAHAAQRQPDASYRTLRDGLIVHIHPGSILFEAKSPEWIVYHELVITNRPYMRELVAVPSAKWLVEAAPHYYEWHRAAAPRASGTIGDSVTSLSTAEWLDRDRASAAASRAQHRAFMRDLTQN